MGRIAFLGIRCLAALSLSLVTAGAALAQPVARVPKETPAEPLILSGQVVDASGRKPIPNALVRVSEDAGAAVRADAEGRFRVEAPGRRRFVLEVLAPGFLLKRS
jgi:protocatechuate 3,4-dioxygenase beta subunit